MTDQPAFEPGNLVRLKSGGPVMTVRMVSVDPEAVDGVEVDWFNKERQILRCSFPLTSLYKVDPDDVEDWED